MKNKHLLNIIGEIDDKYVAKAAPAVTKPWLKWGAIAACLCVVIIGVAAIFGGNQANTVQNWNSSYTGEDYFKFCNGNGGDSPSEMKIDAAVMPYSDSCYFSDRRTEMEANGVIPKIETHPLFDFIARYKDDDLNYVELIWNRRDAKGLENYSDLKVIAGYEEVPIIDDCIFVETDKNGKILEPSVTVTERDGVEIIARGSEKTEKTLTYQTENGWYQISGSWNDNFDSVAALLDWFWEHPLDFTQYTKDAGDNYISSTLDEMPDAFKEYLPDFASFGFVEEGTTLVLKNGVPVHFEGHYVAHIDAEKVKNQEYYDEEGYTLMHWCILAEPSVYDYDGCLGDIDSLTEEKITGFLANTDNKLVFTQDDLLIVVYPDKADEAWELIESLQK